MKIFSAGITNHFSPWAYNVSAHRTAPWEKQLIKPAHEYRDTIMRWQCDCLIPIPLHPSRQKKRGFNQAEEIARRIGEEWSLPIDTKVLIRVKKTRPQKDLDSATRQKNLEDAFIADKKRAQAYKRVILVDDIYTTGSTMESCAKALLAAGVQQVYGFALSSGRDEA